MAHVVDWPTLAAILFERIVIAIEKCVAPVNFAVRFAMTAPGLIEFCLCLLPVGLNVRQAGPGHR